MFSELFSTEIGFQKIGYLFAKNLGNIKFQRYLISMLKNLNQNELNSFLSTQRMTECINNLGISELSNLMTTPTFTR